jgi:F0F1-type ATP synthase assembly protein I
MSKKKEPKKSDALRFSSLGIQMGITIGLGAWLGTWLDEKYQTEKPYYTISIILLAILISMYQIIRDVILMSKANEKEDSNEEE